MLLYFDSPVQLLATKYTFWSACKPFAEQMQQKYLITKVFLGFQPPCWEPEPRNVNKGVSQSVVYEWCHCGSLKKINLKQNDC